MIPVLDLIAHIYYMGYKNTRFEELGQREYRAATALQLTFGFPGGFLVSYVLAHYWPFYREMCDKYFVLSYILVIAYLVIIMWAVRKIYTDERMQKIDAGYKRKIPVGLARLIMVFALLCMALSTMFFMEGWIGQFARPPAQNTHNVRPAHAIHAQ